MDTHYYSFEGLLLEDTWLTPAYVGCDEQGQITYLSSEHPKEATQEVKGFAIPAFQNAHSHAFQYAMAGIAEKHPAGESPDDFWSWRSAMYKLALAIDPEQLEHIATMLYAEMLRHGYSQVAEFHYLHHDKAGNKFNNLAEMGSRLVAAAKKTGINITLIPIFYQKGGFGMEYNDQQRRFISHNAEEYVKLWEASHEAIMHYDGASIAMGFHSLRAVEEQSISRVLEMLPNDLPVHIHISEQLKEVTDALEYWGKRPVQWLLDNQNVNSRFHLVHATHLDDSEVEGITKAGAYVVLCPSTEGNLGDGIFKLADFQENGGKWSIGTDSHIGLNPLEELRILDYGQRLITHSRNSFYGEGITDSGPYSIAQCLPAGRSAMGNHDQKYFAVGQAFDAVVYDADQPLLAGCSIENLLSTIVYAGDSQWLKGTIVNGKWMVKEGHHQDGYEIRNNFINTIKTLEIR